MELSSKKKVLITGASGFIGLNIVKTFYKDNCWEIYALVHKSFPNELKELENVNILRGSLSDEKFASSLSDFDVIVHAAGMAADIGPEEKFRQINYESVKLLCNLPKEKFIYISSTDVYGIKDFINADENTPFCEYPKNPYPRYKIKSEEYLKEHCTKKYVIIRPAAVWGENDKTLESRFVDFLKYSPFIVHFGKWKGQNRWPLADVDNVAKTILAVAKNNIFDFQAINIIDSKITTIDEYYRILGKKYFPDRSFRTITLPFWLGKVIGFISSVISNTFSLDKPIYDPTYYAVHHVSSNLDFTSDKMKSALKLLDK